MVAGRSMQPARASGTIGREPRARTYISNRFVATGAATLGLLVGACAQLPRAAAPGTAAGVRARLAMMRYEMHGMSGSIMVVDSGRIVLQEGYGLADRERGVSASASTAYDVGSITKTFTAAAILRLVADGRIDLRASIARYLNDVPADKATITVHDVLTHTAGFPLDPSDAGITSADSSRVYVAKALRAPLVRVSGNTYAYSNVGYGLLAIIVEGQSGENFRSFVTRTLIKPARLAHTRWWGESVAMVGSDAARGYEFSDREYVLTPEVPFSRGAPNSPMWSKWPLGAAGIVATVGDLTTWLEALRNNRLLPDSLTQRLFESQTAGAGGQSYGWNVATNAVMGRRVYRGGGRTGFTSLLAYYPDRRSSIAFALNQQADANWQTVVWRSLERAVAGTPDTLPPATIAIAPEALRAMTGRYEVAPGAYVRITAEEGNLVVGGEGQSAADVLVEQRPEDSASTIVANRRSLLIVREAMRGVVGETTRALVNDPTALGEWIRTRAHNVTAESVMLLGTVPHPAGPGIVHTFVQLGKSGNAPVIRLIWERDRVGAFADGIRLPGFGRFRMTSKETAVAYHALDRGWRTIEFSRAGSSQVTGIAVVRASGERSGTLHRVR